MKTIDQIRKELREKRAKETELRTANSAIKTLLETEKRAMTDAELTEVEARQVELGTLSSEIAALDKEERAAFALANIKPVDLGLGNGEERELRKFDINKAMRAATTGGERELGETFEKEMQAEAVKEFREANAGLSPKANSVLIPMSVLRAISSKKEKRDVTTSGAAGGYNIATNLNGYVEALTEKSRLLQLGTGMITGAVGNIDYSQENVRFDLAFAAENGTAGESSPTYTKLSLTPKRAAGYMDVSNQWLLQTSPDFQAKLWNQMFDAVARLLDRTGITGGGSNEPVGIMSTTGVGRFYAGGAADNSVNANGAAPVFADAINAYKVVGNAKGLTDSSAHLMTYDLAAKLMQIKKDAGSGEFVWDEDTIMGRLAKASTHVKNDFTKGTGTALSGWIFGDFASTEFFQWGGVELLSDPYTQAVSGLTRVHVANYVDFAVYTPGSLAYGKDFITT